MLSQVYKDYKGYKVFSDGRIFSYKSDRFLKVKPLKSGYVQVELSLNGVPERVYLHRLLGKLFIPNPHDRPCINHKNFNKSDNRVDNLEWCTHKENSEHARDGGRLKIPDNSGHFSAKEKVALKLLTSYGYSQQFLADLCGVTQACVSKSLRR